MDKVVYVVQTDNRVTIEYKLLTLEVEGLGKAQDRADIRQLLVYLERRPQRVSYCHFEGIRVVGKQYIQRIPYNIELINQSSRVIRADSECLGQCHARADYTECIGQTSDVIRAIADYHIHRPYALYACQQIWKCV